MTPREAFERFLADYYEVLIEVAERPGVVLPAQAWASPALGAPATAVLVYGLDMPKPIEDLEVTDAGISATLSFSCKPCKTFVPWEAVLGLRCEGPRPRAKPQLRSV